MKSTLPPTQKRIANRNKVLEVVSLESRYSAGIIIFWMWLERQALLARLLVIAQFTVKNLQTHRTTFLGRD